MWRWWDSWSGTPHRPDLRQPRTCPAGPPAGLGEVIDAEELAVVPALAIANIARQPQYPKTAEAAARLMGTPSVVVAPLTAGDARRVGIWARELFDGDLAAACAVLEALRFEAQIITADGGRYRTALGGDLSGIVDL